MPPASGRRGAVVSVAAHTLATPEPQEQHLAPAHPPRLAGPLRLRVGELVEVKSQSEILATLDRAGALDGLVFMPEMLAFCGKRAKVLKRADKTCDTVKDSGLRRMRDTVHLEGTRCDGSAHAGCQASCEIFWKEAWLRRVSIPARPGDRERPEQTGGCTREDLGAATQRASEGDAADVIYRCQNTDLREASTPLPPWQVMQYVRDVWSGTAGVSETLRSLLWTVSRFGRSHLPGYRIQIWLYAMVQRLTGAPPFLDLGGELTKTPSGTLGLVPGEFVQVKSVAEIRATLTPSQRNRGLYFDMEMAPYCGRTLVVRSRVTRIINEKTGRLLTIPGDCVTLEGATCTGCYHGCCPRAIYGYWREIWLRRVPGPAKP